ncbi:SpeD [Synechococcus phage S-PM2]|uniref:SpeD n=1 Tax=Synechococcus phage S-PM2 TaxID=238854 RepID=Q5GQE8_BPSYP|nr:S-adenosylmethionine decarboxylase [Synechococcus phage S-PM2]CAF34254.1 SpeD [Synechococcus phage S-PM2]CFW42401.1 SpeD [Synechococcus phage S-PM2]
MGDHFLLNLFECDSDRLDDEDLIRKILINAATSADMTIIDMMSHKFHPQGVTAIIMLAESHISIHTWPEEYKAAVDVYTCGTKAKPRVACEIISHELNCIHFNIKHIVRN